MSDESAKDEMDNEDLRRQIDQTRSDLSEKLTELEAQVAGTILSTGTIYCNLLLIKILN